MPDRTVVWSDWVRWKHRFTGLVLACLATTAVAVVIGFIAFVASGRSADDVINAKAEAADARAEAAAARAETAEVKATLTEEIASRNGMLIFEQCQRINRVIQGNRNFVESISANSPRLADTLAQYDKDNPQEECVQPERALTPTG